MRTTWQVLPLVAVVGLVGCATIPTGPSVMVLPGRGKTFEQFQADDAVCRSWASAQAGTTPGAAATESAVSSAAIGTVLGAGLGAAIGTASGNPGVGAAIGAGSGALGGTMVGVGASQGAAGSVQWRYNIAYEQCMYAKGNQIPAVMQPPPRRYTAPPSPPPPPAGRWAVGPTSTDTASLRAGGPGDSPGEDEQGCAPTPRGRPSRV